MEERYKPGSRRNQSSSSSKTNSRKHSSNSRKHSSKPVGKSRSSTRNSTSSRHAVGSSTNPGSATTTVSSAGASNQTIVLTSDNLADDAALHVRTAGSPETTPGTPGIIQAGGLPDVPDGSEASTETQFCDRLSSVTDYCKPLDSTGDNKTEEGNQYAGTRDDNQADSESIHSSSSSDDNKSDEDVQSKEQSSDGLDENSEGQEKKIKVVNLFSARLINWIQPSYIC